MTYIEERTYYPDGCLPGDINADSFKVGVYYRGNGKWVVATNREGWVQFTHTGKALSHPEKFLAMRWCRHDFETACRLAEENVNTRTVFGLTWAEWAAHDHDRNKAAPLIRQRMEERRERGAHVA